MPGSCTPPFGTVSNMSFCQTPLRLHVTSLVLMLNAIIFIDFLSVEEFPDALLAFVDGGGGSLKESPSA